MIIAYAQQGIDDGFPPLENREYFEKKGFLYLDDEWSLAIVRIWLNAVRSDGFRIYVDPSVVFAYAEEWGMSKVHTLEIVQHIERRIDRGNG